ncbi:hypothetical protein [Mycobacteroides abscessus]|uniref:hypothetical protein n=1 Tax=Mycobacteroides abscessus TaxID=36809 RepID=UPI000C258F5F|nr:hypothetical protein [Mycobacteroides abscessus]
MSKLLRGTVVRELKIEFGRKAARYSNDWYRWFQVDEGSLKFYRVGKQARFRFTCGGVLMDGPMRKIIGEDTLLPITYEDVAANTSGTRVFLPSLDREDVTVERRRELFREFRARELDRDEERDDDR